MKFQLLIHSGLFSVLLKEQMPLLSVQTTLNRIRQDLECVSHEAVTHPHQNALCQYMMSKRDDDVCSRDDSLVGAVFVWRYTLSLVEEK